MKNAERVHGTVPGGGRQGPTPSGVSQMIRQAEKLMAEGRYALAMEQLLQAQHLQPGNQYIRAIMERARLLEASSAPSEDPGRYLSVTVGNRFQGGIKGSDTDEPTSPEQTRLRIRELTETAHILLNRGLSESAFDTLMKAYLLDPLNPDVISAEKRVLPAWELAQRQKPATMNIDPGAAAQTSGGPTNPGPSIPSTGVEAQSAEERGFLGFFRRKR